jgi:sugar phosphate isomerase/epimerase
MTMSYTRRDFGKLALAGLPAAAWLETPMVGTALFQAKPNSLVRGVQIGLITYSYGGMPDQSGEATLRYILESGISAVELMDGPAEQYAGRPPAAPRGGGPGAAAGGGRAQAAAPGAAAAAASPPAAAPAAPAAAPAGAAPGGRAAGAPGGGGRGPAFPEGAAFNGQPCSALGRGGAGGAGRAGGRGAATPLSPEQIAAAQAEQQAAAERLKEWRTSVSMDKFKALRTLYNDAGVRIYAYKPDGIQKNLQTSNEEWDYIFGAAVALGANHVTMELPGGPDAEALLKKVGSVAEKHKIYAAYHTHAQGSMTAFDQALAISKANMINVDFGHYVAAGNQGGTPMQFMQKHHARMLSFHIKDRTLPERCSLNLPFGEGDTPLKEILQMVQRNKWTSLIPTIELEYAVPAGSDKVLEAKKAVAYCRQALEA